MGSNESHLVPKGTTGLVRRDDNRSISKEHGQIFHADPFATGLIDTFRVLSEQDRAVFPEKDSFNYFLAPEDLDLVVTLQFIGEATNALPFLGHSLDKTPPSAEQVSLALSSLKIAYDVISSSEQKYSSQFQSKRLLQSCFEKLKEMYVKSHDAVTMVKVLPPNLHFLFSDIRSALLNEGKALRFAGSLVADYYSSQQSPDHYNFPPEDDRLQTLGLLYPQVTTFIERMRTNFEYLRTSQNPDEIRDVLLGRISQAP